MDENRLQEVFADYRQQLNSLDKPCRYVAYGDSFGGELGPREFAYLHMARDRTRDLANTLNEFCHYMNQLQAWECAYSETPEDERIDVLFEFVQPLAFLCLGQPYVIEQRMLGAVHELSREANRVTGRGPADKRRRASLKSASHVASVWDEWESFARSLTGLNSDGFMKRVYNFRHEFTHGFPRQLEIGLTPFVTVEVLDGSVRTRIGAQPPLPLSDVTGALRNQHEIASACFESYLLLMREQRDAVHG